MAPPVVAVGARLTREELRTPTTALRWRVLVQGFEHPRQICGHPEDADDISQAQGLVAVGGEDGHRDRAQVVVDGPCLEEIEAAQHRHHEIKDDCVRPRLRAVPQQGQRQALRA